MLLMPLTACGHPKVAYQGSAECTNEYSEDGTLIGLYLLIAGIMLVVATLVEVFLRKKCGNDVSALNDNQQIRTLPRRL